MARGNFDPEIKQAIAPNGAESTGKQAQLPAKPPPFPPRGAGPMPPAPNRPPIAQARPPMPPMAGGGGGGGALSPHAMMAASIAHAILQHGGR